MPVLAWKNLAGQGLLLGRLSTVERPLAGSHAAFCSLPQMVQKQLKKCRNTEQKEKLQRLLNRMVSSGQLLLSVGHWEGGV